MRLNGCFRVFLAVLIVSLVGICILLRMMADVQIEQVKADAAWGNDICYCSGFRSGFRAGARAATDALVFDTNIGQWTLERNILLETLRQVRPGGRYSGSYKLDLPDLLRPISPLSPLWTLTNELIFDTNTGEWALGKPLRRPRYGGRYNPVPPPAGH
ncbi:MAG TPA: hypothetical protein VGR14_05340 [Verrucomicrobiae bacterium]|jgi:hypothetical protein|nr:hypothetical protein [Verrucomicrobiae bacterium]